MPDPTVRLLQLLTELQSRPGRTGAELAERLGITRRTVRRDIDRLRTMGYPVEATRGVGGYRLRVGTSMPPLLLEDDEATAVAVALRTAAVLGGVAGIEGAVVAALTKLEQILPSRLRRRVSAIAAAVETAPPTGPTVDVDVLTTLASACRDHRQLDIDYHDHDGQDTRRRIDPHRLVHTGRHWYLVAFDGSRGDWRTFRADRVALHHPPGAAFTPRPLPTDSAADMVTRGVGAVLWPHRETVQLHSPIDQAARRRLPSGWSLEAVSDTSCLLHAGAESPQRLALYLLGLELDFSVPPDSPLVEPLRTLQARATITETPHPARQR